MVEAVQIKGERTTREMSAPAPSALPGDEGRGDQIVRARQSIEFAVENMNCGACMRKIERELVDIPGLTHVRANLSKKRVRVDFNPTAIDADFIKSSLHDIGFQVHQLSEEGDQSETGDRDLLRRLSVSGFAAANVMLLSVAVWAGAASDMDRSLMTLFHWLSALIALPAIAYSGQPFFSSARQALSARRLNMDVPISLAVLLATGMSIYQTANGGEHVYFDASVTLLFFLLIGRYLDQRMRSRAKSAAQNLMELKSEFATRVLGDGTTENISTRRLAPGMVLLIAAGEAIPADGTVIEGGSTIDEALLTGESKPRAVAARDRVYAGTINHTAPFRINVTATDNDTILAEIGRLMDAAEQARGRYVRLADRAAAIYAPGIHLIGGLTFLAWLSAGAGWEQSLTIAISVLIITCPCALALAVPAVQVAAASRLFSKGMILKSGDGLERLAEVDYVVFDKTGTLTHGEPGLQNATEITNTLLYRVGAIATASRHPYSRAILRAAEERLGPIEASSGVSEYAGHGLSQKTAEGEWRLGSKSWCSLGADQGDVLGREKTGTLWFSGPDTDPVVFQFLDPLRPDAIATVARLQEQKFGVELLSGDASEIVKETARTVGIDNWSAEMKPDGKIKRLAQLEAQGYRVLMVGDGLNDAPALTAGHASLAPSSAADISKTAADVILQGRYLSPITDLINIARKARRLSLQNFALAAGYNAICIPLAVAGYVTPLIAAIAMSASSIAVTANALRLHWNKMEQPS